MCGGAKGFYRFLILDLGFWIWDGSFYKGIEVTLSEHLKDVEKNQANHEFHKWDESHKSFVLFVNSCHSCFFFLSVESVTLTVNHAQNFKQKVEFLPPAEGSGAIIAPIDSRRTKEHT